MALQIKSAIPHPKIMGVIRECGGKMHMGEREWEMARNDFFEAFKNYDEAGVQRRVQCLKYLVMSTMLTNSDINPFDSQARPPARPPAPHQPFRSGRRDAVRVRARVRTPPSAPARPPAARLPGGEPPTLGSPSRTPTTPRRRSRTRTTRRSSR